MYRATEIYELEKQQIFMKYWLSVGRVQEIPTVGDYLTFQVMKESIVVSRPAADVVVAYMNQCLHRGLEVAVGRGNAKEFSCPYHAWLYDVSGKLVVAPGMKASEVDLKNCSLRQLHVKIWRGWVDARRQRSHVARLAISPTETKVICCLLFPEAAFSIPNYDEEMDKYIGFARQIISEDAVMAEGMRNTAGSEFFKPGPMSPLEEALYHMENYYVDVMTTEA